MIGYDYLDQIHSSLLKLTKIPIKEFAFKDYCAKKATWKWNKIKSRKKKWSTTYSTNFNSKKLNFDIYQVFKLHFMWILGWGNVININQTKSKVKYIKIFHILVKCKTTNYVVKCANFSFASYFPIDAFVWLLLMAF